MAFGETTCEADAKVELPVSFGLAGVPSSEVPYQCFFLGPAQPTAQPSPKPNPAQPKARLGPAQSPAQHKAQGSPKPSPAQSPARPSPKPSAAQPGPTQPGPA